MILDTPAQEEFDDAVEWHDQQRPGLARLFADAIRASLTRIAANPKLHAVVYKDVRKTVVPRFRYCIFYTIEPTHILVISVFHTSRDPAIWKGRR